MSSECITTEMKKPPAKAIAAAVAGNALEFYDFIIYSFFAVHIGASFFQIGRAHV